MTEYDKIMKFPPGGRMGSFDHHWQEIVCLLNVIEGVMDYVQAPHTTAFCVRIVEVLDDMRAANDDARQGNPKDDAIIAEKVADCIALIQIPIMRLSLQPVFYDYVIDQLQKVNQLAGQRRIDAQAGQDGENRSRAA